MAKRTIKTKSEVINDLLPKDIEIPDVVEIVSEIEEKEQFEALYTSKGRERSIGIFDNIPEAMRELDRLGASVRRIKKL